MSTEKKVNKFKVEVKFLDKGDRVWTKRFMYVNAVNDYVSSLKPYASEIKVIPL